MLSKQHYEELVTYHELFSLVASDYIPSGNNGIVNAVEKIHQQHFNTSPTDMYCASCVFNMLNRIMAEMRIYKLNSQFPQQETQQQKEVQEKKQRGRPKRNGQ
jgi:hypothetical protein